MRGTFPPRSFARGARCAMLFASVTLAGAAQAQSQAPTPSGTPSGTPAPTQTLSPTVPAPTLPTLSTPTQAPVIKPSVIKPSAPIPDAPAITLPQASPSRATPPARRAAAPATRLTPAAEPRPQPSATPEAAPEATPVPAPVPTAQVPAAPSEPPSSDASAAPEASASAEPTSALPTEPSTDSGPGWWPWAAGLGAVAVALAAFAWRRRRPAPVEAPADETVPVAPVTPPPAPPAPPPVRPAPAPLPPEPIDLPPANIPAGLAVTLHADRLSATLVNATLSCRLVLTNHGTQALTDLALSGDMTSAHASRPMDEQLGLAGPELPPLRTLDRLEPGQSLTIPAEMRLPLSAILTIRAGNAQLFVPIVRASVWATVAESGAAAHAHAAFLVGQPAAPGDPAARLQPFRLDQGPRVFDTLDQRPMPLPAL